MDGWRVRARERVGHRVEANMREILAEDAPADLPFSVDAEKRNDSERRRTMQKPTLGHIVHYVGKQGVHATRAAIVTCTTAEANTGTDLTPLTSDLHVHLHVLTPGPRGFFVEEDIPFSAEPEPGTWSWPPRV